MAILGVGGLAGCLADDEDPSPEDDGDDDTDHEPPADDTDEEFSYDVSEVVTGLAHPWGITFLPDGDECLVTEREGTLQRVNVDEGSMQELDGLPDVQAEGQGGLLDVALHPAYPDDPFVYLTYVSEDEGGSATTFGRGQLNGDRLDDFEELYVVEPYLGSTGHFGSRVQFDEDGYVFVTTGDRQSKDFGDDHISQDPSNGYGSILRFTADGEIPDDNPFLGDEDGLDATYAYGIRNTQGMARHPQTDDLWFSDHGEQDGDEINILERGGNFGWPIATYGCTYTGGDPIGAMPDERDDVVAPVYFWECNSGGFPPAGMTFYEGEAFPSLQGDLLLGNLAGQYLGRFAVDGRDVTEVDPLLPDRGWRIRDVTLGPADDIYVLVDDSSAPLVRLSPT